MNQVALTTLTAHFPDLLRSWRKLRKLSQWDLSMTTGISQRHLSFLESGRSSPSREMVLKLAGTLNVPLQEQNTLLGSAGFAPMFQAAALDDDSMAQAKMALDIMLTHHEPYPSLVVDRTWNMIMTNEANIRLFSLFVDPITVWNDIEDDGGQNIIRLALHPNGLKPFIQNWDVYANYFLKGLRQELRANPYALGIRSLLDEISTYPDVPGQDTSNIATPELPFLTMELKSADQTLSLFSMVSTFGSPHNVTLQQLRIETFFPADDASERAIREMSAQ